MQQKDGVKSTSITSRPRTRGRTTANRSCLLERLISPSLAASGAGIWFFSAFPSSGPPASAGRAVAPQV